MSHNIIFIGGIHGVGKTSLCNMLCKQLDINHYSASDLIKKVKNIEFPANKYINEVEENQDSLIVGVKNYINGESVYLLDGHFCLLDSNGNIVNVPISTFLSLSPMAIIVLNDDPRNIYARIEARDGVKTGISNITLFQDSEISYSKLISETLKIPYLLANPLTDGEVIKEFIKNII